eukprot:8228993-Pyramimonas_sp.AAC.1
MGDDGAGGGAPAPGAPLDEAAVALVIDVLKRRARASIVQIEEAEKLAAARKGLPLQKGTVSLVTKPDGQVLFLIWADVAARMGRSMRLDEKNRIIALA